MELFLTNWKEHTKKILTYLLDFKPIIGNNNTKTKIRSETIKPYSIIKT